MDRAYTTVATLVRILHEKGFLRPTKRSGRSATSRRGRMRRCPGFVERRVAAGVPRLAEQLLVRLVGQRKLTAKERAVLEDILKEQDQ